MFYTKSCFFFVQRPNSGVSRFVVEVYTSHTVIQGGTKKRELLKNPVKIEEIQEKKIY